MPFLLAKIPFELYCDLIYYYILILHTQTYMTEIKRRQLPKFGYANVFAQSNKSQLNPFAKEKLHDKEWLYDEYIIMNRSAQNIADELKVSKSTVVDYAAKYGLTKR